MKSSNFIRYTILSFIAVLLVSSGLYTSFITLKSVVTGDGPESIKWNLYYLIGCPGAIALLFSFTCFCIWLMTCSANWLFSGYFKWDLTTNEKTFFWRKDKVWE